MQTSGVFELAAVWKARGYPTTVSFKDALMHKGDLAIVAKHVSSLTDNSHEWSACTKISESLAKKDFLLQLYNGGCRTLELGVETLDRATSLLIKKPQSEKTLWALLDAAAEVQLPIVVNYITGFPGEGIAAQATFDRLKGEINAREQVGLQVRLEHNNFQLERLSPMGRTPGKYGLRVLVDPSSIPAATVLPHECVK